MENLGRVKLHRKLLDNPIASNGNLLGFFCYLLLCAAHEDHDFYLGLEKIEQKAGQMIVSQRKLASYFDVSISTINKWLSVLKKEGIIERQANSKYTVVTLLNWTTYQEGANTKRTPTERQAKAKRTPTETIKNDKNEENDKNEKNISEQEIKFYSQMFFSTEQEYSKLKEDFGGANLDKMLNSYDAYIVNNKNGKNYKSPYLAVRNRLQKEADQGKIKLPMKSKQRGDMSWEERQKEEQKAKASKKLYNSLIQQGLQ